MANRDWYCEDVLTGKLEVNKIRENDLVLAFDHPNPLGAVHVVTIPKKHITSLLSVEAKEGALLVSIMEAIQCVARIKGLEKEGFYVRANAIAKGVTPHMHWHIIGPGISDA